MTNILAVDTSTEYCSVALQRGEQVQHLCERVPRRHNQRLFSMLQELLDGGNLPAQGVDTLAWNCGPGSFTGLRIAASAVQGLAFAHGLPVAGVSTLACVAQGLHRRGELLEGEAALVVLDARINEIYWGLYRMEQGLARSLCEDAVGAPGELPLDAMQGLGQGLMQEQGQGQGQSQALSLVCGDGLEQLAPMLQAAGWTARQIPEAAPDAQDILPLAARLVAEGRLLGAERVEPVYLRNEIGWKKLAEQGPQA